MQLNVLTFIKPNGKVEKVQTCDNMAMKFVQHAQ